VLEWRFGGEKNQECTIYKIYQDHSIKMFEEFVGI